MTIYGVGYRGLEYEPTSWFTRIWPIARLEYTKLFRSKRGLALFIMAFWYVLVKAGSLYVRLGVAVDEEGEQLRRSFQLMQRVNENLNAFINPFEPAFYFDHALEHGFPVFLIFTSVISVRAIAGDRATNALEIYWTRGISSLGYFLGKWIGSFLLLAAIFVLGPLFLWIFSQLIAPNWDYLSNTVDHVPTGLLVLLFQCAVLSFLAVTFSAMAKSPNLATFVWFGFLLGTKVVAEILETLARNFWARWDEALAYDAIWVWDAVTRVCYDLAGQVRPGRHDYSVGIAWLSLGVYTALSLVILRRQLRTERGVA